MTLDSHSIADALLAAPGWARVGLTAPDPRTRERAADTLATYLCDRIERPAIQQDRAQLPLPL